MNMMTGLIITEMNEEQKTPEQQKQVALTGVTVDVSIEGIASQVTITQNYKNTEQQAIEAVYCFPVDEAAAVCGFEVTTGDRIITGKVEEREKAFEIYDNAIQQGNASYLLDQESQDVLYISVGNIKPDQEVSIKIRYVSELPVSDGTVRLQIPATVSPRYSPPGSDPVLVDRINPPLAGETPYALALQVKVLTESFSGLSSPSHALKTSSHGEYTYVTLKEEITALDRDFILEISNARQQEPVAILGTHENGDQAVLLRFYPELEEIDTGTGHRSEVIFVLDCSGSMSGSSIAEAKAALDLSLRSLDEGDLFNIILFGSSYKMMSKGPMVYNTSTFRSAQKYIKQIDANMGGTELAGVMSYICNLPRPGDHHRDVILLTDGEVSNPDEVIRMAATAGEKTRFFTFGIGYGASQHLVKGLARAGNGACEMIQPGEKIHAKVLRQFSRLSQPFLTGISVTTKNMEIKLPGRLPPLFDGDSYSLFARVLTLDREGAEIQFNGRFLDKNYTWKARLMEPAGSAAMIPTLWALGYVKELKMGRTGGSNQVQRKSGQIEKEITELGIRYNILTENTSFVAVEQRTAEAKTNGQPLFRRIPVQLTKDWHGTDSMDLLGGAGYLALGGMDQDELSPLLSPVAARAPRSYRKSFFSGFSGFGGQKSGKKSRPDRKQRKQEETEMAAAPEEWYIRLLQTQQPAGFFTGMEIAAAQAGIGRQDIINLINSAGFKDQQLGEKILVTLLSLKLLRADAEAMTVSKRALAKAEKWLEKALLKAAVSGAEVEALVKQQFQM